MLHGDVTEKIIGCFYRVYNELGWGFLEHVYHNAILHELRKTGLGVETQKPFKVFYDGIQVGRYFADIVVDGVVILELKSAERIAPEHEAQLLNYLKASKILVGLVLNFGPKPTFARKVYDTARYTKLYASTSGDAVADEVQI